jgi:LCP family protein required for cell wall assembly
MGRRRGYWEERRRRGGLGRALGLTLVSSMMWGFAHLCSGRRLAGAFLLMLFVGFFGTVGLGVALYYGTPALQSKVKQLALNPQVLAGLGISLLVVALVWSTIVIRSYQLTRPDYMPRWMGAIGGFVVVLLCLSVTTPLVYGAHAAYTGRNFVNDVFPSGGVAGPPVDKENPWKDKPRVNVLLLGGDSAGNRVGVRTDSMTVASVDTKTGDTVLFGLPRNLENAPMPENLRTLFPRGFTGDGTAPGLLNEVWQYAEDHPNLLPTTRKGQRGPKMLKAVISQILGIRVDYYILVDMFGFAGIIDAIGGVRIKIERPIPYGLRGQVIRPGNRKLGGSEAMWYGRSRTGGDDYTRMSRQKCLMRAIAKQANPTTVITKFQGLVRATKRAMSTDIPQELLPALVELADKFKGGAQIRSLQFVPPVTNPAFPNFRVIRARVAQSIAQSKAARNNANNPSAAPQPSTPAAPGSGRGGQGNAQAQGKRKVGADNLDLTCPS